MQMSEKERKKYEDFLTWLITPQDDKEQDNFKEKGLVDDYITIINSIPDKSDDELLDSIDIQLSRYGKSIDRTQIK